MRKIFIFIILAALVVISGNSFAQMTGKAVVSRAKEVSDRKVSHRVQKSSRSEQSEQILGILSMVPIVITSEANSNNKNKVKVTVSPTSINFGITF